MYKTQLFDENTHFLKMKLASLFELPNIVFALFQTCWDTLYLIVVFCQIWKYSLKVYFRSSDVCSMAEICASIFNHLRKHQGSHDVLQARCLKITEKVSFPTLWAILIWQKFIENAKNGPFFPMFGILSIFRLMSIFSFWSMFVFWSNLGLRSIFEFWSILASFWRSEACGQAVLPDR